jgi:isoleucyl-tRNA synthetase
LSTNSADLYSLLKEYASHLPEAFIVSEVDLRHGEQDLSVGVERANGTKCERCWKYKTDVGSDPDFPTICATCADAIKS